MFERFTERARQVVVLAQEEARILKHNYIGTEHILLGVVRENEGVATRILLDFDADSEMIRGEVIRMLDDPAARPSPAPRGAPAGRSPEHTGLSDALLDGAGPPLRTLIQELEQRLGRPADAGDLLVLLASVPGGLAARALASLGMEPDVLARATEEVRSDGGRSALLPPAELLAECEQARAEKEAAIGAQQFERAASLRDRERKLLNRARDGAAKGHEDLLAQVRARLGLGEE